MDGPVIQLSPEKDMTFRHEG